MEYLITFVASNKRGTASGKSTYISDEPLEQVCVDFKPEIAKNLKEYLKKKGMNNTFNPEEIEITSISNKTRLREEAIDKINVHNLNVFFEIIKKRRAGEM